MGFIPEPATAPRPAAKAGPQAEEDTRWENARIVTMNRFKVISPLCSTTTNAYKENTLVYVYGDNNMQIPLDVESSEAPGIAFSHPHDDGSFSRIDEVLHGDKNDKDFE